jgi:aerobic carbon-monoxide dehydrogenase small subunit
VKIRCTVDGVAVRAEAPPMLRLLDLLRDRVGRTGTKEGCGEGECGACAVLLDGELVNSCLVPACQADGREVLTVEGLAGPDGELHPLQQAFWETGGAQCGICTPGMLLAGVALLDRESSPDEAAIREALAGNLCRCTGYVKIVEAVALAARRQRGAGRRRRSETPGKRSRKRKTGA